MTEEFPEWLKGLAGEDLQFIKRFILASGSLKTLATEYAVSYPTLRIRLDRLIEKVKVCDDASIEDQFQKQIRILVADGKLGEGDALELLKAYRNSTKKGIDHGV